MTTQTKGYTVKAIRTNGNYVVFREGVRAAAFELLEDATDWAWSDRIMRGMDKNAYVIANGTIGESFVTGASLA